ncbi:MAG: NADH-quinone oxidoreductase subunit A [Acidobacteriota bacterium]
MTDSLFPVFLVFLASAFIVASILILTHLLGGRRDSRVDLTPYECGMTPFEPARKRFTVKFYLIAMLFILFDIEAAFLYPWAVTFREFSNLKIFVLIEMMVFIGILFVGFLYVWKSGGLDWDK